MIRRQFSAPTHPARRAALRTLGATVLTGSGLLAASTAATPANLATAATGSKKSPRRIRPPSRDLLPGGRFDGYIREMAEQDRFSGTVLLAHRGRPVLARAYGMADKLRGIRNRIDTIYTLASVGKFFTGVAIGQLAAQEKLDLHAPLGSYLEGFSDEVAETVTVQHLFTHTSGLGNYQNDPDWREARKGWTTAQQEFEETMRYIRQVTSPRHVPGTRYEYSNSGYYVLGAIVAKVSGETFWDYMRKHIFVRAGMFDSGYFTYPQWQANRNIAHAYGPVQPDGGRPDVTLQMTGIGIGGGAGGAFASAPDLLRFANALRKWQLLNRGFTHLVTSGRHPIGPADYNPNQPAAQQLLIGCGIDERLVYNQRVFGHSGSSPMPGGISANINIYPDLEWVAIVLCNYTIDLRAFLEMQDQIVTRQT